MEGLKKKSREFNFRLRKQKRLQFFKQNRQNLIEKLQRQQRESRLISEFVLENKSPTNPEAENLISVRIRLDLEKIFIVLKQNGIFT